MSIDIAESVLKSELTDKDKQYQYVNSRIDELKLN